MYNKSQHSKLEEEFMSRKHSSHRSFYQITHKLLIYRMNLAANEIVHGIMAKHK